MNKVNKVRKDKKKNVSFYKRIGFYLFILTFICLTVFLYQLYNFNVLPNSMLACVLIGLLGVFILLFILWYKFTNVVIRFVTCLLCLLLGISSGLGIYYLGEVVSTLYDMSSESTKMKKVITIYSLIESNLKEEDLEGRTIGILKNSNRENIDKYLSNFTGIKIKEYTSTITMINDFRGQSIDCICIDQSILPTIEEYDGFDELESEIKEVCSYTYYIEKTDKAEKVDVAEEPFSILISGIDTRTNSFDDPDSRSDVNIVVTVNPTARQVFILSIPRDYYVTTACDAEDGCANGQKDKLTHTGWHGVATTEKTIEKLMDMDINYNVRVNFGTVTTLVDLLDGIDIYSAENINNLGNGNSTCTVVTGTNHLNGECALAFSRERYAYESGDRQRGKNQMQVLTAVLKKMISPATLKNFSSILSNMSKFIQTNMDMEEITSIVNKQLSEGGQWTVSTYSLDGTGGTDYAYELGDNAYVMYPDQNTIDTAKKDIKSVLNGETPPYTVTQDTIG